jgi:hypothetical protein
VGVERFLVLPFIIESLANHVRGHDGGSLLNLKRRKLVVVYLGWLQTLANQLRNNGAEGPPSSGGEASNCRQNVFIQVKCGSHNSMIAS